MAKKTKTKQLHFQQELDLTDFSDPEDIECISEDGLWSLACKVSTTAHIGWSFVDLYRDEKKPGIVHLIYEKQNEDV